MTKEDQLPINTTSFLVDRLKKVRKYPLNEFVFSGIVSLFARHFKLDITGMKKISKSGCLEISAMVRMRMLKLDGKSYVWLVNNEPITVLPSEEHTTVCHLENWSFPS